MVSLGIAAVVTVNGLLLMGAGAVLVWAVAFGEGDRTASHPEAWEAEAESLAREVQAIAAADGAIDPDAVRSRLVPLSAKLRGHARSAPTAVDDGAIELAEELGRQCYTVGMGHSLERAARTGVFLPDRLDALEETAVRLETAVE